jgi:hypothetical protein
MLAWNACVAFAATVAVEGTTAMLWGLEGAAARAPGMAVPRPIPIVISAVKKQDLHLTD